MERPRGSNPTTWCSLAILLRSRQPKLPRPNKTPPKSRLPMHRSSNHRAKRSAHFQKGLICQGRLLRAALEVSVQLRDSKWADNLKAEKWGGLSNPPHVGIPEIRTAVAVE